MKLRASDKKLRAVLEDERECAKLFGTAMAKKIILRLTSLRAAKSLADFWPAYSGPERCHELKGNLAGTYSMDVKQPYRILFKPTDPVEEVEKELGSEEELGAKQRWMAIRSIELISIEDTHG